MISIISFDDCSSNIIPSEIAHMHVSVFHNYSANCSLFREILILAEHKRKKDINKMIRVDQAPSLNTHVRASDNAEDLCTCWLVM